MTARYNSVYLDFAEMQAERKIPVSMEETEFEKYRIVQDRLFKSYFDRFIELEATAKKQVERKGERRKKKS